MYGFAFIALATTSYVHHSTRDYIPTELRDVHYTIDQVAVWAVILTGAFYFITSLSPADGLLPVITFATVGLLYVYGKYTRQFCFDADRTVAQRSHICMHAVSSIGHHAILAGL